MKIDSRNNAKVAISKPSFKANIRIVNEQNFSKVLKTLPDCFEVGRKTNAEWFLSEAAVNKRAAFTLDVHNCVVGSIFNPETQRANMFHLSPYRQNMNNLEYIENEIFNQAVLLKGKTDARLEGAIFGGDSYTNEGFLNVVLDKISNGMFRSTEYSYEEYQMAWNVQLLRRMRAVFSRIASQLGMDYTVLAGRKCDSFVNVISDAETGTHYLNIQNAYPPIHRVSDLADIYKSRAISPKDKIDVVI